MDCASESLARRGSADKLSHAYPALSRSQSVYFVRRIAVSHSASSPVASLAPNHRRSLLNLFRGAMLDTLSHFPMHQVSTNRTMATLTTAGSSVRLIAVLSVLLSVSMLQAQTDPTGGIVSFSTRVVGPVDSLDVATGSVMISIPMRSKPGKMPFAASLLMNPHIYEYNAGGGAKTMWQP